MISRFGFTVRTEEIMSTGMLHLHNILRWVVLIAGLVAIIRATLALRSAKPYNRMPGLIFVMSLHFQIVLGLFVYFGISGLTAAFLNDPAAAMKMPLLRFFGLEHPLGMVLAAVVATIGSARARRALDDQKKNRTSAVFFTIAMMLIFASIPWPFRAGGVGRGLFPGSSTPAAPVAPQPIQTPLG